MTQNLFSVADKVVVVTGASRGIGRAVAEGFLTAGAKVALVARSPEMLENVKAFPDSQVLGIQADLSDNSSAQTICQQVLDKFSRIDALINNAGISIIEGDPYDFKTWEQTLAVNLTSVFQLSQQVAETMRQQHQGTIIHVASVASSLGFPDSPAYQASKGGLRQLSKAMARDWCNDGIRVNCICPGYFRTAMTAKSYAIAEKREARSQRTMMGRFGEPKELVGPCLFLASDASSYITGQDLYVDGGLTAKAL